MSVVIGIGMRTGADLSLLEDALRGQPVAALATIKPRAEVLGPLAMRLGLPLVVIAPGDLANVPTPSASDRIMALYRCGSVAEACALVAAGPGSVIVQPRLALGGTTWAAARKAPL
ncbi:cobalamin biosynthesis protein [Falsirhodobacter xinxiangensis]|uniref:cobalamin biosynthesis protein n=1 Tax=Falsirhodobacter xinxiangensis TaxID=2530049 RepID=UPI00145BBADB|nr:cobalamin biosynthesis protein [Rhodobacter xinxiangensis]